MRDKRSQWRYIYIDIVTIPLFAYILFLSMTLGGFDRSKNLADMRRIFSRGWKPRASLFMTIVICLSQLTYIFHLTHFKTKLLQSTTSHLSLSIPHSRFCTKSTRGDTHESSLVKTTEKLILILAQRWRIGRVMYSTPFWAVVTSVWRALKFGENLSARSACWVENSSNSSSLSEY